MELNDLRIFKTVAEEGGILRASRKLHRVQSNVSTRIRQLESSVGTMLFHRERQRLVLSAAGEKLLQYADRLLRLSVEARSAVSGSHPGGVLKLGALESTAASRLPEILASYHRAYPDVSIELVTGTNDALTSAVARRELDGAFVAEKPSVRALSSMPLFAERLVIISALGHRRIEGPRDIEDDSVTGDPDHSVACLLTTEVRSRIWRGLQEGEAPGQLRHLVVEDDQPVRAHAPHRLGGEGIPAIFSTDRCLTRYRSSTRLLWPERRRWTLPAAARDSNRRRTSG